MNTSLRKLIDIAVAQVGVREEGADNTGPRIIDYQGATWLAPGPWPWCAAFTCWVMREWLEDSEVRQALNLQSSSAVSLWRCRDASAFGWEKWAKSHDALILSEDSLAQTGDFVVFDFSHIGIVSEDQVSLSSSIRTIEGNTNSKGERNSSTGDGVWRKERMAKLTKSYIRIFS